MDPHAGRLLTIKTAQRRLAVAGTTVAAMLAAPRPELRLVAGWVLLAVVWATVPGLVRSLQLAADRPGPTAAVSDPAGAGTPGATAPAAVERGRVNPAGAALRSPPR